ncbi:TIGR03943 family protein [Nocardia sp. NPDC005998]|uniref:TIGR03943 family putative permease subunit n=1 Tax=Nocardia sp. NPDC005998 TaxID=3156894 RepID=UPI0033BC4795
MKRETQNLLLLLIGAAVLWITLDGSYLRYVKPSLYLYLLVSGVGFVLLAMVAIIRDIHCGKAFDERDYAFGRGDELGGGDVLSHADQHGLSDPHGRVDARSHSDMFAHTDTHGPSDIHGRGQVHGDHGHEHGSGRAQWLLLAPAAALLLIAPPALGAGAAVTSSPVQVAPRDLPAAQPKLLAFPPLPPEPAPALPIVDLVERALQDSSHSLDGREVTIRGFVIRPKDLEQQHPDAPDADLARVVITCCVADARYVLVHLAGMREVIEDDAWLEVRGVVETGSAQRDPDRTPTFVVSDYRRIEAPDRPYERGR